MNRRIVKISVGIAVACLLAFGAAAIAQATGAFEDGESSISGPAAERAKAAALRITGGGAANAVERESEQGAAYEVEVTRKDGTTVDVLLDGSFDLVTVDGDSETDDGDAE
jgi:hypothetical protein